LEKKFEQTLLINGWNNKRCQREAAAAMESTAAEFTSDILGFGDGRDIQVLLNLYETRFLPAAAGQLAAAQFQTAAQMDGEQIAVWHARLRTIFESAFPGENIQNSRLLINKFILKLDDSNFRQWTDRANPATYNDAMTAASNEAASQSILAHEASGGGKSNVALNAFGSGGGGRGACHGCGSYNHHIAKCPKHCPDRYRDNKPTGRGKRRSRMRRRKRRRRIQPDLSTVKRNKRIKRNGTNKRVPQQQQERRRRQWHWQGGWTVRPILQQTWRSGRYPQPQQRQRGTRPGKLLRSPRQGPRQTDTFAAYIASLSEEDNAVANYCKYISCRLSVLALLDSGNIWRNVISE
jgi:hypothetical protein